MNPRMRCFWLASLLAAALCLNGQGRQQDVVLEVDQIGGENPRMPAGIHAVLLDETGYLWIGSAQGLARYDGYRVIPFRIAAGAAADPAVRSLCQAPGGRLWLATPAGLLRVDPASGRVERFRHAVGRPESIGSDDLTCLHAAPALPGRLWIGSAAGTLDALDVGTGRVRRMVPAPGLGAVHALASDAAGVLWIAAAGGLFHCLPAEERVVADPLPTAVPALPRPDGVSSLWIDPAAPGGLWLAAPGAGLLRFSPATGAWQRCLGEAAGGAPAPGDVRINAIAPFPDDGGSLLLGTDEGLYRYDPMAQRCRRVPLWVDGKVLRAGRVILFIQPDRNGIFWIGSRSEGLCKWSRLRKNFHVHLPYGEEGPAGSGRGPLPNPLANWVTSFQDRGPDGILLTTYGGGILFFDRRDNSFRRLLLDRGRPGRKLNQFITDSRSDRGGDLWFLTGEGLARCAPDGRLQRLFAVSADLAEEVLTFAFAVGRRGQAWIASDRGLVRLDTGDGSLRRYRHDFRDPRSLSHDRVNAVLEDDAGAVWAATDEGLDLYRPQDDGFAVFRNDPGDPRSLASSQVNSLMQDSRGRLWLCTAGGIDLLERKDGRVAFRHFPAPGGEPAQRMVLSLVEETPRTFWAGTSAGLARFEPERGTYTFYDRRDGIVADGVAEAFCGLRSRDGELFFGGRRGFFRFRPEGIAFNRRPPRLVSTGYRIYDTPEAAAAGEMVPFTPAADDIPGRKVVRIEFAALDFARPEKNQYAFRLEGIDKDWVYQGTKRVYELPKLPVGRYTLQAKAANNEGIWNEFPTAVPVRVRRPHWIQWRFPALAALVVIAAAGTWVLLRRRRRRLLRMAVPDNLERVLEKFSISRREGEIVRLLLAGKSNKQIEDELYIAMATVKIHVHNIYRKVGVGSRLQLVLKLQQEAQKLG
ncbi:MAG TPA: two-component regulator propeller domain-containing protein [Candidatus Aminicenantes bacterium]|nr:two-component regulator propeller domain-containing protein [Candidatus Aminicenantes bacterium]